jgi:hypothetical protein
MSSDFAELRPQRGVRQELGAGHRFAARRPRPVRAEPQPDEKIQFGRSPCLVLKLYELYRNFESKGIWNILVK